MRKVLITGASGGIGLGVAKLLAAKKYQITLVARREEALNKAKNSLAGIGHTIHVCDLTKPEDVQKLVTHIEGHSYDILINNAGVGMYGQFIQMPLDEQLSSMQLNMNTLVVLSYAFLKKAKSGDALVNVASMLGHSSFPGASVYAATKSFVANFSESLWFEFKKKNIFILGFNPGATRTDFHSNAGGETSSYPEFVLSNIEDVANDLVRALEKRNKPRVVSGWKNRMMLFTFKLLSRSTAVNIMGGISPGMKY
ncbi:SDR family NAD(P)-dependent oxidoreductase [Flectobacillus longus]|uniref:SDR family NAD(P)-dependent oxidoreductase n=1 Tax=Flectobacillus longus TaxID=2984207 RepID=UPI0024B6377D|nr:SDR family NAD(P)-dependent oxidoreductase [Flectobacillus longus]MDI9882628.1 SDR family NAD(P)-dependent oxidoreductase [Flectobacillus longus]